MNKKFYLHVDQRHCETQELCGLCRCNFPSNSMYTGVNTGKNWVHRFLVKQKRNVPKARKSKLGVWGTNTYYVNTIITALKKCPLN